MAKDQTVVVSSPFKFGFFAGVGFFVASMMMTVVTFLLAALLGLGTIGAIISSAHAAQTTDQKNSASDAKPVRWQVSDSR
jgi:hypothetical protein